MTMAELLGLGCPPLPEGRFYRLRDGGWHFELEIRQERKKFGSRRIASRVVHREWRDTDGNWIDLSAPDAIANTALKMLDALKDDNERYAWNRGMRSYLGDHK